MEEESSERNATYGAIEWAGDKKRRRKLGS